MENLKEKISKLDEMIHKFHAFAELPEQTSKHSVSDYLNMSRTEIEALTAEGAAGAALELSLYGYHLQKVSNKNRARMKWCESELKRVFGELSRTYNLYSYEEKKNAIIHDNEYATKLHSFIMECSARDESLYGVALQLKAICDALKGIQYAKRSVQGVF